MSRALQILSANAVIDGYRLVYLTGRLLGPMYAGIEREFGINRPECLVIFCLAQVPDLTAQEIADVSVRPKNTISRAVRRLLGLNIIVRTHDTSDGRKALLSLSAVGRKLYAEVLPRWIEHERLFFEPLSDDERRLFATSLGKLTASFVGRAR